MIRHSSYNGGGGGGAGGGGGGCFTDHITDTGAVQTVEDEETW